MTINLSKKECQKILYQHGLALRENWPTNNELIKMIEVAYPDLKRSCYLMDYVENY